MPALLAVSAPRQAVLRLVVVAAALPVHHYRRGRVSVTPFLEESV
jgi:hypothetical protein